MNWQLPLTLGGPVLQWELVRASRRLWPRVLRYLYVGFLLIELILLLFGVAAEIAGVALIGMFIAASMGMSYSAWAQDWK